MCRRKHNCAETFRHFILRHRSVRSISVSSIHEQWKALALCIISSIFDMSKSGGRQPAAWALSAAHSPMEVLVPFTHDTYHQGLCPSFPTPLCSNFWPPHVVADGKRAACCFLNVRCALRATKRYSREESCGRGWKYWVGRIAQTAFWRCVLLRAPYITEPRVPSDVPEADARYNRAIIYY